MSTQSYAAKFVQNNANNAVAPVETNLEPTDYSKLTPGRKILVTRFGPQYPGGRIEEEATAAEEISFFDPKKGTWPSFAHIWMTQKGAECKNPTPIPTRGMQHTVVAAHKDLISHAFYSVQPDLVFFREPLAQSNSVLFGYLMPEYDGGLTINKTEILPGQGGTTRCVYPILRMGYGKRVYFKTGDPMNDDESQLIAARAAGADTEALEKAYWHAHNAYWRYAAVIDLVYGECARLQLGEKSWPYVRDMFTEAQLTAGDPVTALKHTFARVRANLLSREVYLAQQENPDSFTGFPAKIHKWGTVDSFWSAEELDAIPVGSLVKLYVSPSAYASFARTSWVADAKQQLSFLSKLNGTEEHPIAEPTLAVE